MQEIEVKIIDINKEEMIKKLKALGAEKVFEGEVKSAFYDYNDLSLVKNNKLVRLRKKGDKSIITFKKKVSKDNAKVMEEIESELTNIDEMEKILFGLGLKHKGGYLKKELLTN